MEEKKKMKRITLYVVTHKNMESYLLERTQIGVGDNKEISNVKIYDDTGDNISNKNLYYCELTALYWIWKNDFSDIVGLEHYRRQFVRGNELLNKKTVATLMNDFDVLVPCKCNLAHSIYHNYVKEHEKSDIVTTGEIIREKYPDYIDSFDYLKKTNRMYVCNMFIAGRKFVDEYCEWLFTILFELEKRVDLSGRTRYQKRMFGFMAERLFNVYLHHNRKILKVKCIPISEPDEVIFSTQKFSMQREIKYIVKKIINYENMYR